MCAWHASLYDGKVGATAQDDRQLVEAAIAGVGVIDVGDLLVSAGSGLNSSIAAGRASIRNTFATTQGGLYLVRNDAAVSYAHNAGDPTNPRIDQVLAKVYDSETGGDASDVPSGVIVPGTATGGATLDNRTGAGSLAAFNNYILIADVLVPANAASAAAFTYRDRRPIAGNIYPPLLSTSQTVGFQPLAGCVIQSTNPSVSIASNNAQAAVAMYLPRRIVGATKMRWYYTQGSTALTGNYNLGIADSSGRLIVSTGAIALTGVAGSYQQRAETIVSTTFEAGIYYMVQGWASLAGAGTLATGTVGSTTGNGSGALGFANSNTGGTSLPVAINGFSAGTGASIAMPVILST